MTTFTWVGLFGVVDLKSDLQGTEKAGISWGFKHGDALLIEVWGKKLAQGQGKATSILWNTWGTAGIFRNAESYRNQCSGLSAIVTQKL